MANFYTDTPQLRYHLNHPLMKRIVELKERGYADKDKYNYAPVDFEDAMDSYDQVLEVIGEICADIIAPNAESVDHEGPTLENNRVVYAKGTQENLKAVVDAGLMGISMPRRFGGLNFPILPYIMAADMVSRADAGFVNIWGLQDCAETIYEFGTEEQLQRLIPRVCAGETLSMDLTEPDAGSDLQAVRLKASYCEEDGTWRLNGVKRFITNGDSDIHLVLARSEEGTNDGRGLSMFVYQKKDGGVDVRRIENKMGIKGSPTCELVFKNAKAELVGERRLGLIKYVMALMNGARLGIMAQSVGICDAALREGEAYAKDRKQFGQAINRFPAVYEMLAMMRAKTDAARALLYETCRFVDMYKIYDDIARERKLTLEERKEQKHYNRLADAYTPLGKGMCSEFANQNAYDAIQIHGGSGFMKDYACERIYRDVRIASIYEGTTQLQVVAAIRHITTGTYHAQLAAYQETEVKPHLQAMKEEYAHLNDRSRKLIEYVTEYKDQELLDFHARRLVEATGHCVFGHLLMLAANDEDSFQPSAQVYLRYAKAEINKIEDYIKSFDSADLTFFRTSNED